MNYYTMEEILGVGLKVVGPDDEPYGDIQIQTETGSKVCTIPQDDAPVHDYNDRQQKYARLFAAAPDVVVALKAFVDAYEATAEGQPCGSKLVNRHFIAAKSALAKAGVA